MPQCSRKMRVFYVNNVAHGEHPLHVLPRSPLMGDGAVGCHDRMAAAPTSCCDYFIPQSSMNYLQVTAACEQLGAVLSAIYVVLHSILTANLQNRYSYYPYFTSQ